MRLLPRSEVRAEKNIQVTEASRQRRQIFDEITKLTKTLNLEREVKKREHAILEEEFAGKRLLLEEKHRGLAQEISRLESRRQDLLSSLEHLDVERRKVEVSERESLVKKKFDELAAWETNLKVFDDSLSMREVKLSEDEQRICVRLLELDNMKNSLKEKERSLAETETKTLALQKSIEKSLKEREQIVLLREHDLDLKEFQLLSLRELYESHIKEAPREKSPKLKSMVFTTYAGTPSQEGNDQ